MLVVLVATGCSGGGSGGNSATPTNYTMSDLVLKNVSSVGKQGRFIYSTKQTVTVDINLPYPHGLVTIYEKRPLTSLYDTQGNPLSTPVVEKPALLVQGMTSVTAEADGLYHYRETIVLPTSAITVYLASPSSIDVPIINGTVTYQGGVK